MHATDLPQVRSLDERDISSILARNTVGRLAFVRGEQLDILPIQYVYREGVIYGRTAAGGKLAAVNPLGTTVAFEVDEIQSARYWRSVLAHGTFHLVDRHSGHEEWLRALGIVRKLHPAALRQHDPRPDRTEIFRIVIHSTTGRAVG
jgi:uncharacterized protein